MRRGKAQVPTEGELKRLFNVVRAGRHAKRNVALLNVSYRLGLRAKEMASLRIGDVMDERGRIREECTLTARMTKGGKPRTVYLTHAALRQSLKDYLNERREQEDILFSMKLPLFKSQKTSHFDPNTLQQLCHRLHVQAGILGGRSHSGRRWFATELIGTHGVDLRAVATLMGHSSVVVTAAYSEDNPPRLRRIVQALG